MKKLKVRIRPKQRPEPEERRDLDGILSGDDSDSEPEHRVTLSELLDQRRADAEEKQTREDREAYMEKLEAYLKRPITAAELGRPELGKLFGRRNS